MYVQPRVLVPVTYSFYICLHIKLFKKAGESFLFNQHIAHVQRNRKTKGISVSNP